MGKKMVFQKIFECPIKKQQLRRQQKKILEGQRRDQSKEKHVIKQEITEQRKLAEMSKKLVNMTLTVIHHSEKICSTKGKSDKEEVYPDLKILSRELRKVSREAKQE